MKKNKTPKVLITDKVTQNILKHFASCVAKGASTKEMQVAARSFCDGANAITTQIPLKLTKDQWLQVFENLEEELSEYDF